MMPQPNILFLSTDRMLHIIDTTNIEVIHIIYPPSLSTMLNDLLGENILKEAKKIGYIRVMQFTSSFTWPIDINLLERDGTNKVFDRESEGEKAIVLAPETGYVTPLALTM